jgi:hypothetical protein
MKVYSKVFNNSLIEIFKTEEDTSFEFVVKTLNGKREHVGWSATKVKAIEEAKKIADKFSKL